MSEALSQGTGRLGLRVVDRDELNRIERPARPTERFNRLSTHREVLEAAEDYLGENGFVIGRTRLKLYRNDVFFFGELDLTEEIVPGVGLSVGVHNKMVEGYPLFGLFAGFRAASTGVRAYHFLMTHWADHKVGQIRVWRSMKWVAEAVAPYRDEEAARIRKLDAAEITDARAATLTRRAMDAYLLPRGLRDRVLEQWATPPGEQFRPRTGWCLYHAVAAARMSLASSDPLKHAKESAKLAAIFAQSFRLRPSPEVPWVGPGSGLSNDPWHYPRQPLHLLRPPQT